MELGAPAGEQWHLGEDLLATESVVLASSLEALSRRFGGRRDVASSVLAESCARPVALAAAGAFFLEQRVPRIALGTVRLHMGSEGLFDALALDPGTAMTVLRGDRAAAAFSVEEAAGLDELRQRLVHDLVAYLDPLVGAIHDHAGNRTGALWGTMAYTIASSLMILGRATGDQRRARLEADLVLEAASPPLSGAPAWFSVEHRGQDHAIPCRSTCCLLRRVAGEGSCTTCPLLGYEERKHRLLAWLAW